MGDIITELEDSYYHTLDNHKFRLERNSYFMLLAELTALRGTCNRLQVGCVLVDQETNRIISVGYNSSIKGTPHCSEVGCLLEDGHCKRCPHAEVAAIANLQRRYDAIVCYVTHQPCVDCFKLLASVNTKAIVYINEYTSESRDKLTNRTGIRLLKIHPRYFEDKVEILKKL
jgi:dCMP deaminase